MNYVKYGHAPHLSTVEVPLHGVAGSILHLRRSDASRRRAGGFGRAAFFRTPGITQTPGRIEK